MFIWYTPTPQASSTSSTSALMANWSPSNWNFDIFTLRETIGTVSLPFFPQSATFLPEQVRFAARRRGGDIRGNVVRGRTCLPSALSGSPFCLLFRLVPLALLVTTALAACLPPLGFPEMKKTRLLSGAGLRSSTIISHHLYPQVAPRSGVFAAPPDQLCLPSILPRRTGGSQSAPLRFA